MNRWIHPTRICPKHGKQLLVTRSGIVFCGDGLDENNNPTCIHEAPETKIPKAVARAMNRVRKRTRRKLAKNADWRSWKKGKK